MKYSYVWLVVILLISGLSFGKRISVVGATYGVPGTDCKFYRVIIFEDGNNNDPNDDYPIASKIIQGVGCDGYDPGDEEETTTYATLEKNYFEGDCEFFEVEIHSQSGDLLTTGEIRKCGSGKRSLDLEPESKNNISVYPTLAENFISIKYIPHAYSKLLILDSSGGLVKKRECNLCEEVKIDLSGISSGLYFISISHADSKLETFKFFKK